MVIKEAKIFQTPENGNVRLVDPSALMQGNPAALIVNRESYNRMAAHFDPDVFDPPQVVRVTAYSPTGIKERDLVVDGLTRMKYAADHMGEPVEGHADFNFDQLPVRDVTASYLRNPAIVRQDTSTRDTLTMAEYLHAVVPPTAVHSEIATDRIAAHLINGWRNMVGEELAERFSAVAALSLAANSTTSERMFQDYLNRQAALLRDEAPSERHKLNAGLIEMVAVIREAKLRPQQVATAALTLVSLESPTIGGSKEAQRQIWGLLHTPEVQRKLREALPEEGEQEQARAELGKLLMQALQNVAADPNKQRSVDVYQRALVDRDLSIDQVKRVIVADRPSGEYATVKEDITQDRVRQEYMTAERARTLSDVEERLIEQIGRRQNIRPADMPNVVSTLQKATKLSRDISAYFQQLSESADELLAQGVSEELLDDVKQNVSSALIVLLREEEQGKGIDLTGSYQGLIKRTKESENKITTAKQRITRAVNTHKVGGVVDEIYGEELQEGYGLQARKLIVDYVFSTLNVYHESSVRERVKQLQSLDPALQADVLQGTKRLEHALRIQTERNNPEPFVPFVPSAPARVETPMRVAQVDEPKALADLPRTKVAKPATHATLTSTTLPQAPQQPKAITPDSSADVFYEHETAERRRKEINNTRVIRLAQEGRASLRDVDLSKEEMAPEAREELVTFFNETGNLLFGHPNAARLVETHMRNVQRELTDAEAKVKQELDATIRETRTRE